jgi:hypothetical protein
MIQIALFLLVQGRESAASAHFSIRWLWYLSILVLAAMKNGQALARPGHFVMHGVLPA